MRTDDFDFEFPENLIAHQPLPRGESRMMVVDRGPASGPATGEMASPECLENRVTHTRNLIDYLNPGDALVLNDTKVLRARLLGESPSGAKVEVLLLAPVAGPPAGGKSEPVAMRWEAMVKPGKRFRMGDRAIFSPRLSATVVGISGDGTRLLDFGLAPDPFLRELEATGRIPLPPYIKRPDLEADALDYQSVFARHPGSVAAPTASLHLSEPMLEAIAAKGVRLCKVTLHVGAGTFKPVQSERLEDHDMHSESYAMSADTAARLNAVRREGGRIWAVGTTAARVLETRATGTAEPGSGGETFTSGSGTTRIFIYPGYVWKGVDGLLTNFHWPKSTLFMLVCSLVGPERAKRAYAQAFAQRFRLFSYGDAMLIR